MPELVVHTDPSIVFSVAVVREVPTTFSRCMTRPGLRDKIDVGLARQQHAAYTDALRATGLTVFELPSDTLLPDAPFVEDTAVVFPGRNALVGKSACYSRSGETEAVRLFLEDYRTLYDLPPGSTLDGGDVLRIGENLFAGFSSRTNADGLACLERMADLEHLTLHVIEVKGGLHLRSICSYLGDNVLLHAAGRIPSTDFPGCERICAPEAVGANVLAVNGKIIVAQEAPRTVELLTRRGYAVVPVPLSEFLKGNGGPTCLSLRF